MSQTACDLLALIGNCGEIRWDYPSKGARCKEGVSITTADAEELLQLEDLKKYGGNRGIASPGFLRTLYGLPRLTGSHSRKQ